MEAEARMLSSPSESVGAGSRPRVSGSCRVSDSRVTKGRDTSRPMSSQPTGGPWRLLLRMRWQATWNIRSESTM